MSKPRYDANLPSVGLISMFRSPICEDLSTIDADIAFLGIPYDGGIGFRPGTRFGPRDIRTYSVRYSAWGSNVPSGYWDVNQRKRFLKGVRMVDCGDVDIAYYDFETNRRKMTQSIEAILDRGAFPVLLGGDHSVTFPNVCAFSRFGPVDIVHIDAHMDWRDEVGGVRHANASPLRRSKELPFVRHMVHLGIRDVRTSADQIADAEAAGAMVFTRQQIRELGPEAVVERMPRLGNVFVTIDIDGLDPSLVPTTGTPEPGGLGWYETLYLIRKIAEKRRIIGMDLVEFSKAENSDAPAFLCAKLVYKTLAYIFKNETPKVRK